MSVNCCGCSDCRRMRRQGKRLGARLMQHFWRDGVLQGAGYLSDHVRFPRWMKGRRPESKKTIQENFDGQI